MVDVIPAADFEMWSTKEHWLGIEILYSLYLFMIYSKKVELTWKLSFKNLSQVYLLLDLLSSYKSKFEGTLREIHNEGSIRCLIFFRPSAYVNAASSQINIEIPN